MKIVPAVLTDKPEELRRMISQAETFCGLVQIDIMDGRFVPSKSISAEDLMKVKTNLKLEAHLMVEEPSKYLEAFSKAGVKRIVFHYESKENPFEVIAKIRALGLEAGVAINPETPIVDVENFFKDIDILLFLSVNPGFYGSKFLPEVCEKAKSLIGRKDKPIIAMDGGIKADNILLIRDSGVDIACVGSGIYGNGDAKQNYQSLLDRLSG